MLYEVITFGKTCASMGRIILTPYFLYGRENVAQFLDFRSELVFRQVPDQDRVAVFKGLEQFLENRRKHPSYNFV